VISISGSASASLRSITVSTTRRGACDESSRSGRVLKLMRKRASMRDLFDLG